jgi:hypothetical protein
VKQWYSSYKKKKRKNRHKIYLVHRWRDLGKRHDILQNCDIEIADADRLNKSFVDTFLKRLPSAPQIQGQDVLLSWRKAGPLLKFQRPVNQVKVQVLQLQFTEIFKSLVRVDTSLLVATSLLLHFVK